MWPPRFSLPSLLGLMMMLLIYGSINAQTNPGRLVFADEFGRLLVINANGTGQTILITGYNANPAYSPDGSKIAFDQTEGDQTNIFVMNADGTNPVAITTAGPLPNTGLNSDPAWSPDGKKLAFVSDRDGQGKKEIWLVNIDGSGLVKLTTNVFVGNYAQGPVYESDTDPSWSPDGLRIAFESSRDGLSNTELYVMNANGTNQTRLTISPYDDRSPTWSPDSQRIGFSRNGSSAIGINIMNADGSNVVNVTHEGSMPAWSPDGARFAFRQPDPANGFQSGIFIINVDGTNPVAVTNNAFECLTPAWAPGSSTPIPTSTISGHVLDGNGVPISGASLNLTGTFTRSAQSDAAGAYAFAGLPAGNYGIDITKSGFGFNPPSVEFTNLTTDKTANFTAYVAYSISGQVNGLNGNSIYVKLSGSQTRSVLTDSNGHYSFDILPAGGNYVVSITTPIWNVTPKSATFNNLSANQVANFDAVTATYTISGTITRLGIPKPGITVALEDNSGFAPPTTTTDVNGRYSFTGVTAGGTYFVRPTGANYSFQPQTYDYHPLDGDKTADFIALSANHLLFYNSRFLTLGEGACSLQLTVVRGGNATGVGPITVHYATADGSAQAGLDYVAVSGTLSFAEGSYSRTITIPIFSDQLIEGAEEFSISLSNPTGEVDLGESSSTSVTILDSDPATVPKLETETNSDRAITLNAINLLAGPFPLTTPFNFAPDFDPDNRTRVSLFVTNLPVNPCQGLPVVTVDAEDLQHNHLQLPLERILKLPGKNPFVHLIARLPGNVSSGDLLITITADGLQSNKARISIQP